MVSMHVIKRHALKKLRRRDKYDVITNDEKVIQKDNA